MASSKKPSYISQKTFLQVHSLLEFDNLVGTSVYNKAVAEIENINEPRYYPQQIIKLIPEITSRKLNDWDVKGLLVQHRQNNSGWRLFSLADVIRLRIIQDLKTYGMSNIQIQKALNDIFELNDRKRQYLFETFLNICATATKAVIIVEFDGSASFYLEDTAYVNLKMDKSCCKPVLILPFYGYCMPFMPHNEYKMTVTTTDVVNEQNRANLAVIADCLIDEECKEISLKKSNGKLNIKPKRYNKNVSKQDFIKYIQNLDEESFKDIRISLQNGKITTLSEENSILS
ncbi:TPA: hypothetical protein CPT90_08380 [Candidatus Gastranaerophilales bacterium HUM_3]|nr:MAG TPA: hypothetical protein CPT90_08380 [Candidatus Gastranaerophilales bacterium HUM_3]